MAVLMYALMPFILVGAVIASSTTQTHGANISIVASPSTSANNNSVVSSSTASSTTQTQGASISIVASPSTSASNLSIVISSTASPSQIANDVKKNITNVLGKPCTCTANYHSGDTSVKICSEMEKYVICVIATCSPPVDDASPVTQAANKYGRCVNKGQKAQLFVDELRTLSGCTPPSACDAHLNPASVDIQSICKNVSEYAGCIKNCTTKAPPQGLDSLLVQVSKDYSNCENGATHAEDYNDEINAALAQCSVPSGGSQCEPPKIDAGNDKDKCKEMKHFSDCAAAQCGTHVPDVITEAQTLFGKCGACTAAAVSTMVLLASVVMIYLL